MKWIVVSFVIWLIATNRFNKWLALASTPANATPAASGNGAPPTPGMLATPGQPGLKLNSLW